MSARYPQTPRAVDRHAAEYARLATALDRIDQDFLDRDFGADADRDTGARLSPAAIARTARRLRAHLQYAHATQFPARVDNLSRLLDATAARADRIGGRPRPFRDEVAALAGITPDPAAAASAALAPQLDALLPGHGSVAERLAAYEARFVVPRALLHVVLAHALEACRAQTRTHIPLPDDEMVAIEYVADAPWSGYSVYQGGFRSLLRVNRGFAFPMHRLVTLACHEGYPGHHTYEVMRDAEFVRRRGWTEASATPLFSPHGFAAEAVATAAATVAFSRDERLVLLRDHLFPLAGFAPGEAERYARVVELVEGTEAAIASILAAYLEGTLSRTQAAAVLQRDAFMADPQATLAFADRYGAYSLAYTLGANLAMRAVNTDAGTAGERWRNLARLIISPAPLR